jgi:hypothetical protein
VSQIKTSTLIIGLLLLYANSTKFSHKCITSLSLIVVLIIISEGIEDLSQGGFIFQIILDEFQYIF